MFYKRLKLKIAVSGQSDQMIIIRYSINVVSESDCVCCD